jgi:hypothetical protein
MLKRDTQCPSPSLAGQGQGCCEVGFHFVSFSDGVRAGYLHLLNHHPLPSMRLFVFALITLLLPSCAMLDVVEGFRQFGGNSPSKYADWRTRKLP